MTDENKPKENSTAIPNSELARLRAIAISAQVWKMNRNDPFYKIAAEKALVEILEEWNPPFTVGKEFVPPAPGTPTVEVWGAGGTPDPKADAEPKKVCSNCMAPWPCRSCLRHHNLVLLTFYIMGALLLAAAVAMPIALWFRHSR